LVAPLGFYLKEGANTGGLDLSHLHDQTYYGAPDRPGWQWFCGVMEGWEPGRHTLVTYLTQVLALFDDRGTE
jgi:hypothetical protein